MGTDIHLHVMHKKDDSTYEELKVYDKSGNDITYRLPINDRCYALFGKLAGARCVDEPLVEPRGIYKGIEEYIEEKYDNKCYFSPTFYDYCELQAYAESDKALSYYAGDGETPENVIKPFLNDVKTLLCLYDIWFPNPGDVILQMWFDN